MRPSPRLLQTLIGAHRRGRLDPLEEAVTHWRVMPTDLDLFGHMNNSRYLALMDLARIDFLIRVGLLPEVIRNRWIVPIGEASIDFKGPLRLFEPFEISTRLAWWDERWFYFRQEFRRRGERGERGAPVGTGYVRALFREAAGSVPPARVIERVLGHAPPRPEASAELRRRFALDHPAPITPPTREPLAIVGIGCRLPGGIEGPAGLWEALLEGRDCIVDIPESRWDPRKFHDPSGKSPGRAFVQRAGLLQQDLRAFDARFFGITPREANVLDPQQRLLLEVSWEAMEDAGVSPDALAGSRTGVFVGGFMTDNLILHSSPDNRERLDAHSGTASTLTMLSNRLSYVFDLRGPSFSVDTACSSSLVALHQAARSLWAGESDAALVGGVNALLLPETQITLAKGHFLSPRGRCHAFSDQADGYVRAEGAAVILLKPLSAAQRDGNTIHAVLLGTAVNQDGRTPGITVPSGEAQVAVMREAYASAGVDPARVAYVEAHGTGTPVGDPIEARAIGAVVGAGRGPEAACRMGSVKTNLGHLEAAAGITGVIKAALCLKHATVPPHLHLGRVNPNIPLDALGLRIPTSAEPLTREGGALIAGVNSFGYGGTNAHAVLSAPPAPVEAPVQPVSPTGRPHLLLLGAKSPEALATVARRHADWLDTGRSPPEALCRSAALHRAHPRHRLAVRGQSAQALAQALRAFAGGERGAPGLDCVAEPPEPRKVLFVYTGMGPQWWAMGRELIATEPVFRAAVEECDALFRGLGGGSISEELARDEASSRMARTEVAQPANTALQVALTRLWAEWGVVPDGVVGHSIGEVTAAWAAGALSLRDALRVALHRSRLQQRLAGRGGMLAVGLGPDEARVWVERYGPGIAVAAINSEGAVTLAGERAPLERVAAALAAEGRFQRFLQVEVPYHSPVMDSLESELRAALEGLRPEAPRLPLYSTVTGRRVDTERHDAGYWWRNVRDTVRFAEAFACASADGHGVFLEVGPHPVLASAIRDGLRTASAQGEVIASLSRKEPEQESLAAALGKLHAVGVPVRWSRYFGPGRYTGAPSYPWERKVHWEESPRSARRRRAFEGHPLLIQSEQGPPPSWTAELNLAAHPYLADHGVAGSTLFPAAGQLELALAARHLLTGEARCSVEELELSSAVLLREDLSPRLVLSLSADTAAFRTHVEEGERPPVACARGKLFSAGRRPATVDVAALRARLIEKGEVAALYSALERRGLRYGPAFRAVAGLSRGRDEVLAELVLPAQVDARGYHLHPVLLDAAFHSLIAAAEGQPRHDVIPVGIERVHVLDLPGRSVLAHGRLLPAKAGTLRGDITLLREDGTVVAEVTGFTCRLLPQATTEADDRLRRSLYVRSWEPLAADAPVRDQRPEAAPVTWIVLGGASTGLLPAELLRAPDLAALAPMLARIPRGHAARLLDLRWSQRAPETDAPVTDGTTAAAQLLLTVQALAPGQLERYLLVTTGAEDALSRAPLLGLARTVMTERPDLRFTALDLETAPHDLPALLSRLSGLGEEQELAEREGQLRAARVVRTTLPSAAPVAKPQPVPPGGAYALVLDEPGRLDSLGFVARERRAPGVGEVELEVEAASLGFKDVMKVLGLLSDRVKQDTYIGEAIGMEGAGTVSAVGPGVTDVAVGERVYGVAPGFLASHVVLPAANTVRLPAHLSFEQGSNLIVFLTAYHALVNVARLRPGERVLVHGATGGVGLAAIEVARACGAEVIATAGSEEKRRHLAEQGIAHVSPSRDVGFADDVRAWTGGRGVDVVLNFTPGEIMIKGLACLAPFGRFIEIGKGSSEQDAALPLRPFNENLLYASVDFDRLLARRPEEVRAMYREVARRFEDGTLHPLPSTSWPASQVEEAFRAMARGKHIGKVCLTLKDPALRLRQPVRRARCAPDATYLVTGGLGGFGLEVARWLAEQGARHLALVSRRGAPAPEDAAALEALRERGVEVRAFAADVGHLADLERVFSALRASMPPLRGVVHSAAVLDDRPLAELDGGALERVLGAKAGGAWNLHLLTRALPLDFLILFSSVSSLIGNAGQGNYVAANAFLDRLALDRRRQGLPATSVQWGALGEAGLVARSTALGLHLERLGLRGLSTRDALHALGRVIDADVAQVAVVDADWSRLGALQPPWTGARRLSSLLAERAGSAHEDDGASVAERTFAGLDAEARQALGVQSVARVIARVMRVPEDGLDTAQPLRELGMDSIMAVEIVTGLERELGVRLSTLEVASGPSVRDLAALLLGHLPMQKRRKISSSSASEASSPVSSPSAPSASPSSPATTSSVDTVAAVRAWSSDATARASA